MFGLNRVQMIVFRSVIATEKPLPAGAIETLRVYAPAGEVTFAWDTPFYLDTPGEFGVSETQNSYPQVLALVWGRDRQGVVYCRKGSRHLGLDLEAFSRELVAGIVDRFEVPFITDRDRLPGDV